MTTDELTDAVVDLREDDAVRVTERLLDEGTDPAAVLEAARNAMDVIGDRFACGEAFIPELVMAGEIMHAVSEQLKPRLAQGPGGSGQGVVILGTAQGDIHDIGKDIVATMLDIAGFEVIDLGVDVAPERFVEEARAHDATIIGVSALLTQAIESMRRTIATIDEGGLRPSTRVMIGGAPVTDSVREHTGADGWGKDAVAAVELAKSWTARDEEAAPPGDRTTADRDRDVERPAAASE